MPEIEEIVVDGQEQLKRYDHVVLSPDKWIALIASWRERGEALADFLAEEPHYREMDAVQWLKSRTSARKRARAALNGKAKS